MAVEEHGAGRQLMRFRYWPRFSRLGLAGSSLFAALAVWAAVEQSWLVAALLAAGALLLVVSMLHDCAAAGGIVMHALDDQDEYAPASAQPLEALEPVLSQNGSVSATAGRCERRSRSAGKRARRCERRDPAPRRLTGHRSAEGGLGVFKRLRGWNQRRKRRKEAPGRRLGAVEDLAPDHPVPEALPEAGGGLVARSPSSAAVVGLAEPWPLALVIDNVIGDNPPPHIVQGLFGANPDQSGSCWFIVVTRVPDRDRQPRLPRAERLRQREDRAEHGAGPAQRPVRPRPAPLADLPRPSARPAS